MLTPLRTSTLQVGWHRIHAVHAAPDGPPAVATPVVLVHGFVISGRYMRPTLRRVARAAPCWAPDLPGHGRSSTPPRALDVEGYARALLDWMTAAGLPRALLVGNSLGCQVIARAAALAPERASGLVLVGPTVDPRARTVRGQLWRLVKDAFRERPSLWFLEAFDLLRVGPFRVVDMIRITLADRIEEVLPVVRARGIRVLVVRGEHDPLVPDGWARRVAELAGGRLVVVRDGAHGVNYDEPEALTAVILEFAREGA